MLVWVGVAIFLLTVLNVAVGLITFHTFLLHASVSVIVWAAAWAVSRPQFPAKWAAPLAGVCAIVVIGEFQSEYWVHPTAIGFGYILMIMLGAGPIILSPRLVLLVDTCAVFGSVVIVRAAPTAALAGTKAADWILAAVTAEACGFVLLHQRLRSIDELGAVTRRAHATANTDALTGLHNRHGMERAMSVLLETARRAGQEVHVTFVDIDWLKTANDIHGHEFGDSVILAVANAVRDLMQDEGHAIARWGGDEFLVMGIGSGRHADELSAHVLEHIRRSGLDLNKWPGSVSVGSASADAASVNLRELIELADARMYERRREQRSIAAE